MALLLPRVAVVVVAGGLPEPRAALDQELESAQPFGALPEVQVRNQKSRRPAVLGVERLAVELVFPGSATGIDRRVTAGGEVAVRPLGRRDRAREHLQRRRRRLVGDATAGYGRTPRSPWSAAQYVRRPLTGRGYFSAVYGKTGVTDDLSLSSQRLPATRRRRDQ